MSESQLSIALRHFDAAEANLSKAERVLALVDAAIPRSVSFGSNPEYEMNCNIFQEIYAALPKIDGWKPEIVLHDLNALGQARLDAMEIMEIGEIMADLSIDEAIDEPSRLLRDYRFRFTKKRRALVRNALTGLIDDVDSQLQVLGDGYVPEEADRQEFLSSVFQELAARVGQIDVLLGSSVSRPARWNDLQRHIRFGKETDLQDIIRLDWEPVRSGIQKTFYSDSEPIPSEIADIGDLVRAKPVGDVATRLRWENLSDEDFERLIFSLVSFEPSYENPQWLMKTNAPDRGRDVSVFRVHHDSLAGAVRQRTIIQCKHWQSKSVGPAEIATLKEQMKLWDPPRVDLHIIATSGRFTSDAVQAIERHNQSDTGLRIEMWPESHLERLLASRPAIVAEFRLR